MKLSRRDLGLLGVTAAAIAACGKSQASEKGTSAPLPGDSDWRQLDFPATTDLPDGEQALIYATKASAKLATLVALHGRGEAGRGLEAGSHGWRDSYGIEDVYKKLLAPPIASADLGNFESPERLEAINGALKSTPFQGINLICPYTPVLLQADLEGIKPFARFVLESLLPRAAEITRAPRARDHTGIDGVSMGGRAALLIGLSHPEIFGAVGAMQPAIAMGEATDLATLAKKANDRLPISLRLVSSDDDPFLDPVRAFSSELDRLGVPHQTVITHGPHDYVWNKGPGSCEMLLFHERVLRGLSCP